MRRVVRRTAAAVRRRRGAKRRRSATRKSRGFRRRSPLRAGSFGTLSTTQSRSARLMTPSTRPFSTTGSRLMRWAWRASAMSWTGAPAEMVMIGADMTSRTGRSPPEPKMSSREAPSASILSHQSRRPSSDRRPIRSPSLAMPIAAPDESTIGTPPTPCSSISLATWRTVAVSGATTGGRVHQVPGEKIEGALGLSDARQELTSLRPEAERLRATPDRPAWKRNAEPCTGPRRSPSYRETFQHPSAEPIRLPGRAFTKAQ